jgi:hypothetical protein
MFVSPLSSVNTVVKLTHILSLLNIFRIPSLCFIVLSLKACLVHYKSNKLVFQLLYQDICDLQCNTATGCRLFNNSLSDKSWEIDSRESLAAFEFCLEADHSLLLHDAATRGSTFS